MNLEDCKLVFVAVGLIGVLLICTPAIIGAISPPGSEQFSELYILGSNHMLDGIPFNVKAGVTYSVYLGVGNQMGLSSYYTCFVKLRNETEPLPNITLGTPSPLPSLFEYKSILSEGETWEVPLTFQVNKLTFVNGMSHLSSIVINGMEFSVSKESAWNSDKAGYYYSLFVELWVFNSTSGINQYHNRSVHLTLNMTD